MSPKIAFTKCLCIIALLAMLMTPIFPARSQAPLVAFGGYLTNVDYMTCTCGFVIFTIYDMTLKRQYTIIWFYLAQLLSDLGVDFGDVLEMGIPRVYPYAAIWPGSDADVLGNFFPYENAPCAYISMTGCTIEYPGADGYLINMGTSLFRTN